MEEINFEVDKKYTNRKGDFVVVSISGNNMKIRWDNGETVDTTIKFQSRVIANMAIDNKIKKTKSVKKKNTSSTIKADVNFMGLTETDFSKSVTGTTWRSRKCLGGLVTGNLKPENFNFQSHAINRKARVFWQDDNHRDSEKIIYQAKFFAQLDEDNLKCGYYVERSHKEFDDKHDWNGFINWLKKPDNEIWLKKCVSENSFNIDFYLDSDNICQSDILSSVADKWVSVNNEEKKEYSSLLDYLNLISKETWINFHVVKMMSKNDVIAKKLEIADDISSVFNILMPLYKASVMHI